MAVYMAFEIQLPPFEWDDDKDFVNRLKHGIGFDEATKVFRDPKRLILADTAHSANEERFFCAGTANGEVVTVRFVHRGERIRIFGAANWRATRRLYEQQE
jgi:uncharacterized DUF497 family protein